MILNEKHGVTNDTDNERLEKLIQLIADFIYDSRNGLENSNDCFNEDGTKSFGMSTIQPYYEYKERTAKDFDMPSWLNDFNIIIDEQNKDTFYQTSKTEYIDKRLKVSIHIHDYILQSRKSVVAKLSHEFNHAYDDYKLFLDQPRGNKNRNYMVSVNAAKSIAALGTDTYGLISLNDECFSDIERCGNVILSGEYFTSPTEMRSYIKQFVSEITEELKDMQDEVEEYIEHRAAVAHKSNVSRLEQIQSSAQDYGISCTLSDSYKMYKLLYMFWNDIKRVDYDILEDVYQYVTSKNPEISNRNIHIGKADTPRKIMDWLKSLSRKYISQYSKVVTTMQKQFCDILQMIETEYQESSIDIIDFDDADLAQLMKQFDDGVF